MSTHGVNNSNLSKDNIILSKELTRSIQDTKMVLSLFQEGFAITDELQDLLSIFDKDKNKILDKQEIQDLQQTLLNAAQINNDDKLNVNELIDTIKTKSPDTENSTILKQFKALYDRLTTGKSTVTEKLNDDTTAITVSEFKSDGSGKSTRIIKKENVVIATIIKEYMPGGILKRITNAKDPFTTITNYAYNENGKLDSSVAEKSNQDGILVSRIHSNYKYNTNGQITEIQSKKLKVINGELREQISCTKENEYDENGNQTKTTIYKRNNADYTKEEDFYANGLLTKKIEYSGVLSVKDKKVSYQKDAEYNYEYNDNKQLIRQTSDSTTQKNCETKYQYNLDGINKKLETTYFKRGRFYRDTYYGANINNRYGYLPNERIIYESDRKTIKERIVNIFDQDGILIGEKRYDRYGNLIKEEDYSEINGNFENAYQNGRGNCYLLAAIHSITQSQTGRQILKDNIQKNSNGSYTVKLPGSKIARQALIDGTAAQWIKKLPANRVYIKDAYTITATELKNAEKVAGKKYSSGDKDYLLLELVYEKYRKDVEKTLKANNIKEETVRDIPGLDMGNNMDEGDVLSGGLGEVATFILTGKKAESWFSKNDVPTCYIDADCNMHISSSNGLAQITESRKSINASRNKKIDNLLNKLREDYADGKLDTYSAVAGFIVSSQEVNGKIVGKGGHALAIIGVTKNKVILANPWNPQKQIEMSIQDFKMACNHMSCTKLSSNSSNQTTNPSNPPHNTTNTIEHPNNNNNNSSPTKIPQAGRYYIVPKGKGYYTLLKEALTNQGIQATDKNLRKADAQFQKNNPPKTVHYTNNKKNGSRTPYLLEKAKIYIPKFNMD